MVVPKVLVANRGESESSNSCLGLLACLLPISKSPFEFSVLQENLAGAQWLSTPQSLALT